MRAAETIPVLGLPTRFASNDARVMAAVERSFGVWRDLDPAAAAADPRTSIVIDVHDRDVPAADGRLDTSLMDPVRMVIRGAGSIGVCDAARYAVRARVSNALLADAERFRDGMLEALTWALLSRLDRQPLHAAAIVRDDVGLLLCGPSGSGKSTLALTAAQHGLRILAEDMVFLQSRPWLRVWGTAGPIHLRGPGLNGVAGEPRLRNGVTKLAVEVPAGMRPLFVDRCAICVLGARRPQASYRRLGSAELLAAIDLETPGFHIFAASIEPILRRLVGAGGWMLHPSADPADAMPLLASMLDATARGAAA